MLSLARLSDLNPLKILGHNLLFRNLLVLSFRSLGQYPKGLGVALKTPTVSHTLVESCFSIMTKRWMTKIMGETCELGYVRIYIVFFTTKKL